MAVPRARVAVASLSLSAATLVGIALSEGWEPVARPPVQGDVPTVGFGSTRNPDGSPVRDGQRVNPDRALVMLLNDATKFERAVRRCAPVPMHPYEFSAFVSLTYNIGEGAFCRSSIPVKLKAGDYQAACETILQFDKFRDCTKPKVYNPKTGKLECPLIPLKGLTLRREREHRECMGESQ